MQRAQSQKEEHRKICEKSVRSAGKKVIGVQWSVVRKFEDEKGFKSMSE